jgi:hypothetical protein
MKIKLLDHRNFNGDFPYSGLEVFDNRLYFVASNGEEILQTNSKWKAEEKLPVNAGSYHSTVNNTVSIFKESKNAAFLLFGSGAEESDSSLLKMSLKSKETESIDLTVFRSRVKEFGLEYFIVLSVTTINDKTVLLAQHGETRTFIITDNNFYRKQDTADIQLSQLQWEEGKEISIVPAAIHYSYKNDWLIVTGEKHQAGDAVTSTEIFIGIVENAFRKIDRKRIKVNEFLSLAIKEEEQNSLTIRSIVAQEDKENKLKLHMIRSNQTGATSLIKFRLKAS